MEVMEASYSVALRDCPAMPDADRAKAEARYARVLERQFAARHKSPMRWPSCKAWKTRHQKRSLRTPRPFKQWSKASAAANEAGFQGIGDAEGLLLRYGPNELTSWRWIHVGQSKKYS